MGMEGLRKEQLGCKRTEVSVKHRYQEKSKGLAGQSTDNKVGERG